MHTRIVLYILYKCRRAGTSKAGTILYAGSEGCFGGIVKGSENARGYVAVIRGSVIDFWQKCCIWPKTKKLCSYRRRISTRRSRPSKFHVQFFFKQNVIARNVNGHIVVHGPYFALQDFLAGAMCAPPFLPFCTCKFTPLVLMDFCILF